MKKKNVPVAFPISADFRNGIYFCRYENGPFVLPIIELELSDHKLFIF